TAGSGRGLPSSSICPWFDVRLIGGARAIATVCPRPAQRGEGKGEEPQPRWRLDALLACFFGFDFAGCDSALAVLLAFLGASAFAAAGGDSVFVWASASATRSFDFAIAFGSSDGV